MSNLPVPIGGGGVPVADLTDALRSAADYARADKAEATRNAYASDWADFEAWCRTIGEGELTVPPQTFGTGNRI